MYRMVFSIPMWRVEIIVVVEVIEADPGKGVADSHVEGGLPGINSSHGRLIDSGFGGSAGASVADPCQQHQRHQPDATDNTGEND